MLYIFSIQGTTLYAISIFVLKMNSDYYHILPGNCSCHSCVLPLIFSLIDQSWINFTFCHDSFYFLESLRVTSWIFGSLFVLSFKKIILTNPNNNFIIWQFQIKHIIPYFASKLINLFICCLLVNFLF